MGTSIRDTKEMFLKIIVDEIQKLVYGKVTSEYDWMIDRQRLFISNNDLKYAIDLTDDIDAIWQDSVRYCMYGTDFVVEKIMEDYKRTILGKYIL